MMAVQSVDYLACLTASSLDEKFEFLELLRLSLAVFWCFENLNFVYYYYITICLFILT